ncbi:hypothetical protein Pla144_41630 [Bythopirellula polymerisocia]|uniref:Uncharacterized protein n=1 Tax=Bythopirellula polymerisocia TaxID=2528003 RepID=A0A5C6CF17_9BACT|nr:hypothetical protein Pla144_41630 [Bythopirellula polymerisocia]
MNEIILAFSLISGSDQSLGSPLPSETNTVTLFSIRNQAVRAKLGVLVLMLLKKYDCPPDLQEAAPEPYQSKPRCCVGTSGVRYLGRGLFGHGMVRVSFAFSTNGNYRL